jgi:hypothetical protein
MTRTAVSTFCGKRCARRWKKVSDKYGLTRSSDPDLIRCRRLLGDAYFALQSRYAELRNDALREPT